MIRGKFPGTSQFYEIKGRYLNILDSEERVLITIPVSSVTKNEVSSFEEGLRFYIQHVQNIIKLYSILEIKTPKKGNL
jgi:hypothetical protein